MDINTNKAKRRKLDVKPRNIRRRKPAPPPPSILFNLPMDLFVQVWEHLPPYSRICLLLTCRQIFAKHYNAELFLEVCENTPARRLQYARLLSGSISHQVFQSPASVQHRLYLIRHLRKDLPDVGPDVYCDNCDDFHARSPHGFRQSHIIHTLRLGFLYSDSKFALVREIIEHLLSDALPPNCDLTVGPFPSPYPPPAMDLEHEISDETRDTLTRTTLHDYRRANIPIDPHSAPDVRHYANLVRATNLQICRHLWLGEDFSPGDGSFNDVAERTSILSASSGWRWWRTSYRWRRVTCGRCGNSARIEAPWLGRVKIWVTRRLEPREVRRMYGGLPILVREGAVSGVVGRLSHD